MDSKTILAIIEEDDYILSFLSSVNDYLLLDEEDENTKTKRPRKRRIEIFRNREQGHLQLLNDYFVEEDQRTYTDEMFRRRFRMHRDLFNRIVDGVVEYDNYFVQKFDAARQPNFSPIQKVACAIRLLAYGIPADLTDDMFRMGESTAFESLKRFCKAVVNVFG